MTAHLLLSTRVCFGRRLKEKISGSEYSGGFTFSGRRGLMISAMAMAMAERSLSTGEDTERTAKGVLEIGVLSFKGFGFVSNSNLFKVWGFFFLRVKIYLVFIF